MSAAAYPLTWPAGRPRSRHTREALFRDGNQGGKRVSLDLARDRLELQMSKLGATNIILSMNIRLTLTGRRDMNLSRNEPIDTGAALYFDLGGQPHVLACDRWDRVADNIAAIAAHVEALRGQERWGVADLRQAFAGHVALPAPAKPWTEILGVRADASAEEVSRAYRAKAKAAGSDQQLLLAVNLARDAAMAEKETR
ncbi:MAG: hypothetical protein JWN59_1753 [Sphingomonas bacterium]|nr:hypothetical protein [Sphingomonas bacterium]